MTSPRTLSSAPTRTNAEEALRSCTGFGTRGSLGDARPQQSLCARISSDAECPTYSLSVAAEVQWPPSLRHVVEGVRVGTGPLVAIQLCNVRHVRAGQLEVEDVEVLLNPRARDRLPEHNVATLDVPAQCDLRRRLALRFGDPHDRGVVEHLPLGDGRPRLGGDAVLGVEGTNLLVGQVRMDLHLVDRRGHAGLAVDAPQVVRLEVRDADRLDPTGLVDRLHGLPGLHEVSDAGQRPMHEEQVQVPDVEVLERLIEGLQRVVVRVVAVVELAGHEDVVAVDARRPNRLADLLLVAVHLGGVDVSVADLEGRQCRLLGAFRLDLEDTETQLGDLDTVVQRDVWYGGHATPSRRLVEGTVPSRTVLYRGPCACGGAERSVGMTMSERDPPVNRPGIPIQRAVTNQTTR